jgi:protease-4
MGSFPQPPKRNRVLPVVIGVAVLLFVVGMAAVGLLAGTSGGGSTTSGGGLGIWGPKIGVLNIEGVIVSDDTPGVASTKVLVEQVKAWAKNDSIKAIVLRVNSPGGGVSATQDLYHALNEFREKTNKPVITSMGDIAASGGYYTAMASDEVYANEGTLTGSIGVILSFYDLQNLQDKVGIHPRNVKSGQFKDIGSASRSMTLEEQELLNEMIGDVFDQFFEVVMANRAPQVRSKIALANNLRVEDVTDDQVRDYLMQYCDGRIFSGRQATETGMIDGTMTLEQVLDHTRQKLGLDPQTGVVVAPVRPKGLFGSISGIANKLNNLPIDGHPGAKFEYRFAP